MSSTAKPTPRPIVIILLGLSALVSLGRWVVLPLFKAGPGESCFSADECRSGLCLQSGVVGGFCTARCGSDAACDGDMVCASDDEGTRYCVNPPTLSYGEACTEAHQCLDGPCVTTPFDLVGHCSHPCGFAGGSCPDGAVCNGEFCVDPSWVPRRAVDDDPLSSAGGL